MSGPARYRVPLPTSGALPRIGKIRLGVTVPTGKKVRFGGELIDGMRPVKKDHFIVNADESTSEEAAQAFHTVYGDEPRQLRCLIPGNTPDDVFEGAWRLYGTRKLKRRCNGEECSIRTDTGWLETGCACKAEGLAEDDKGHCQLTYTLQLLLPDVPGVGVWQIDTGSEISARNMADWLAMMATLVGDLALLEFDLRLVPVQVAPPAIGGKTSTVYVLQPVAHDMTPRRMLAGDARRRPDRVRLAELPAPAADEQPETTLDQSHFIEESSSVLGGDDDTPALGPPGAGATAGEDAPVPPAPPSTGASDPPSRFIPPSNTSSRPLSDEPRSHYGNVIHALNHEATSEQKLEVKNLCKQLGIPPSGKAISDLLPDVDTLPDILTGLRFRVDRKVADSLDLPDPKQGTLA